MKKIIKKSLFIFVVISVCFLFSACINKMASRYVDNWEAQTLKKLENPEPGEEPLLRAQLADIYNAKAQFILVNEPEKEEEALNYLQQSVDLCNYIIKQWPNEYEHDPNVKTKVNLTMGGNMFLLKKYDEIGKWCSLISDTKCPQVLKELQ